MQMIEQHLAAEGTADRQLQALGEGLEIGDGIGAQRVPPRMTIGRSALASRAE
jgi:hypothetical protein